MRSWIVKLMDAMTEEEIIPDKFFFASHSCGGWLTAQYASQRPERIEGLFLMSPAGTDPYNEKTWDPYSAKDPNDLRYVLKREQVDKIIANIESLTHPLSTLHAYPSFVTKPYAKAWIFSCFKEGMYADTHREAAFQYFWTMKERISVVDCAQLLPFKFECYGIHPLQAEDRLGNPDIDFPIGIAFGDRDKFGSEGAEVIIKNNRHFATGRS